MSETLQTKDDKGLVSPTPERLAQRAPRHAMERPPEPVPRPDFAHTTHYYFPYFITVTHFRHTGASRGASCHTSFVQHSGTVHCILFTRVRTALLFVQRTVGPPQVEAQLSWVKLYGRRVDGSDRQRSFHAVFVVRRLFKVSVAQQMPHKQPQPHCPRQLERNAPCCHENGPTWQRPRVRPRRRRDPKEAGPSCCPPPRRCPRLDTRKHGRVDHACTGGPS